MLTDEKELDSAATHWRREEEMCGGRPLPFAFVDRKPRQHIDIARAE
jgi:hypothetical protein